MEYNFRDVEKKWQKYWAEKKPFKAENNSSKPKYYVLDMFPYPSGAGLHVGHPLGYIASDIYARYKRLCGFNVLHPMGFDAFGLPAEQYAIQTGQHPAVTTEQNIKRYREQLDNIGFSFDWDREVRTSDPAFYKWTQWIFLKLFNAWYNPATNKAESIDSLIKNLEANALSSGEGRGEAWTSLNEKQKSDLLMDYRLAYLSEAYVNWCPALGTVLANDEVKDGVSERGGYPVERKLMKQWSLRITSYAQRLLDDLETIDWSESIKEQQRNWIGRSEGASLKFRLIPGPSPREKGAKESNDMNRPGYETSNKLFWPYLKEFAKENRKNLTEAEKIIWEQVRDSKLGFKIRRQHAIDIFIADFVCLEKKLVIEIDGEIHENQKEYDEARTLYLNSHGFQVVRFKNSEVLNEIEDVLQKIKSNLQEAQSERSPLPWRGAGGEAVEVFTTRPDTIFGVTYVTLAPEHELVEQITTADKKAAVMKYLEESKSRSDRERMADVKNISGVFTGAYVEHPFTKKQIPVWVGDYVLAGYGTGAVMAVPAHDSRDFAFANHFKLPVVQVIKPPVDWDFSKASYDEKEGTCINSAFLNGLKVKDAIKKAIEEIEKAAAGKGKINFRLRDAVFGRQRYWGEPIPIYYENGIPKAVDEKDLPVILPEVDKYLPTEDGEPPLARAKNWTYKPHPQPLSKGEGSSGADEVFPLETTTMPGWAGSSWYYLRYMDPKNDKEFVSKDAVNYWRDVDLYIGGAEHATGHLMYVRFWTKFLFDLGLIPIQEPAKKLVNQGMIQGRSLFITYKTFHKIEGGIPDIDHLVPRYCSFNRRNIKVDGEQLVAIDGGLISYHRVPIELGDNGDKFYRNRFHELVKFDKFYEPYYSGFEWDIDEKGEEFILLNSEVEKMSKSKWNVVSPDDVIEKHGADCLRLYEMFLGPLELAKPWNTNGISGTSNFIRKLWRLYHLKSENHTLSSGEGRGEAFNVSDEQPTKEELKSLHKLIKKVKEDIDKLSFNTSVSSFMICVNELTDLKCNKRAILEPLAIVVSPYAPHISEELWELLRHKESITFAKWPEYKEEYLTENSFAYPISVNGKTKFNIEIALSLSKDEIEKEVMSSEEVKKLLQGQPPKKVIVVPGRIVNIVV